MSPSKRSVFKSNSPVHTHPMVSGLYCQLSRLQIENFDLMVAALLELKNICKWRYTSSLLQIESIGSDVAFSDTRPETGNAKWVSLVSSRPSMFHKARENNSLFPLGRVIKCFVISLNLKLKKERKNRLLYAGWLINLPWFLGAWPDHVRGESSLKLLFP